MIAAEVALIQYTKNIEAEFGFAYGGSCSQCRVNGINYKY